MIEKLIPYEKLLSAKQKRDILTVLQNKTKLFFKPAQKQTGGALGAILASIGIPLVIEAGKELYKKIKGKNNTGVERPPILKKKGGLNYPGIPPPFVPRMLFC